MNLAKAEAHQRAHSRRRASERFGVKLTRNIRGFILSQIRKGTAEYIGPSYYGRECYRIAMNAHAHPWWAKVIYDPATRQIVTFMRDGRTV